MVHHVIIHRLVPQRTHRLPQKTLWNTEDSHGCVHESNAPSSRADREARLTTPSTRVKPHRHPLGLLQAQLRLRSQTSRHILHVLQKTKWLTYFICSGWKQPRNCPCNFSLRYLNSVYSCQKGKRKKKGKRCVKNNKIRIAQKSSSSLV